MEESKKEKEPENTTAEQKCNNTNQLTIENGYGHSHSLKEIHHAHEEDTLQL